MSVRQSGRTGQRLVVVLSATPLPRVVLNNLLKHTELPDQHSAQPDGARRRCSAE